MATSSICIKSSGYKTTARKDLTDIIYHTWAGMTAREYKQFKGLKKDMLGKEGDSKPEEEVFC